jgi:hypothetical protein
VYESHSVGCDLCPYVFVVTPTSAVYLDIFTFELIISFWEMDKMTSMSEYFTCISPENIKVWVDFCFRADVMIFCFEINFYVGQCE